MVSRPRRDWCHRARLWEAARGNHRVVRQAPSSSQSNYPGWGVAESEGRKERGESKRGRGQMKREKTTERKWERLKEAKVKTWATARGYSINKVNRGDFCIDRVWGCTAVSYWTRTMTLFGCLTSVGWRVEEFLWMENWLQQNPQVWVCNAGSCEEYETYWLHIKRQDTKWCKWAQ